jgi:hypothetical protein
MPKPSAPRALSMPRKPGWVAANATIRSAIAAESGTWRLVFSPALRRPLVIGIALAALQQVTRQATQRMNLPLPSRAAHPAPQVMSPHMGRRWARRPPRC